MKTYYQVYACFSLSASKLSLVSMSLHSTSEYYPFTLLSAVSPLSLSRFFHSVPEAEQYISYLYSRYPTSKAQRPVLDAKQLLLF